MADDIVTRLRNRTMWHSDRTVTVDELCWSAANDIERLRAAGDKLAEVHIDDLCDCNQSECVTIREAHAAWQEARRG